MTVNTTSQSWFARQGSPEVFITYRTHEHRTLFRARNRLLGRFSGALDIHNNPGARPLFRHPCVGPHNGGDVVLVCLRTRTARRHLRSGLVPRRGNARRPHRDAWHPGATAPRHWRPPAARSRRLHLRSRCWDAGRAGHRSLQRRPCRLYRLRECRHWHERLFRDARRGALAVAESRDARSSAQQVRRGWLRTDRDRRRGKSCRGGGASCRRRRRGHGLTDGPTGGLVPSEHERDRRWRRPRNRHRVARRPVRDRLVRAAASRDTIVTVVLGGEPAVPCTRNPLQRG